MGSPEAGNTRLRSARQALGLRSQQQLADAVTRAGKSIGLRISITARTVRRWESDSAALAASRSPGRRRGAVPASRSPNLASPRPGPAPNPTAPGRKAGRFLPPSRQARPPAR